MRDFFKPWRRKIGVVTLVMACACGCAAKTVQTQTLTTDPNVVRFQVEVKNSDRSVGRLTGRSIEYRLKDAMLFIRDGELRVGGSILATLKESDLVTVEDSRTVMLNGVRVWPNRQTP